MHKRIVKLVYVFQIRLHTVLLLPNAIKNVKTEVQVVNYRKYESKTASASNFKNSRPIFGSRE